VTHSRPYRPEFRAAWSYASTPTHRTYSFMAD